ncbi:MAG TPA: HAMP domain-containing sensor histidine kinase [Candidatus Saccharimonadales bacterium]
MAILRIADFYKRHFATYVAVVALLQIVIITLLTLVAWMAYDLKVLEGYTLILTAASLALVLEIGVGVLMLNFFGKPLNILTNAISNVSKQSNDTLPPNVNKKRYERSGLKALVQTIYELSVASFQGVLQSPNDGSKQQSSDHSVLKSIMELMPSDLVILDSKRSISFYHGTSGLKQTTSGSMELALQFEPANDFEHWLDDCRKNKLRDTRIWKRVANSVQGTENRKVYDVIVHYEKNVSPDVETVLLLIDRTADYARDEDDMDFIALAAHELRAPITVIRGYLDVLTDELAPALSADQKELMARVQVSAERLSGYINNILNVSKFDRAHLKLHLREDTIAGIFRELVQDLSLRAYTLNRHLTFRIPKGLPTVAADRSSISEVITNLVDNAIKYSKDSGEIIIAASVSGNFVELTVQDFGVGMPSNVVGNLFNKFYRSHRSRQQVTGTGLGLYISKAIMESHGGKIWVTSTEGEGSTFGIMLPIYATVADKLKAGHNGNEQIIESSNGWIKNHSMYRG